MTSDSKRNSNKRLLVASSSAASTETDPTSREIVDVSTLTLLEHINLNVPSHEYILPFYYKVLGCGMDPRKVANLKPGAPKKTLWANMGASQFHLPYGETAQSIPGHIGLRYASLDALEERLKAYPDCYKKYTKEEGCLRVLDHYGNEFACRAPPAIEKRRAQDYRQPVLKASDPHYDEYKTIDCLGLDYVEFRCPPGTAAKIALFYETIFDATISVYEDVCIVALGHVDSNGRADQSLIFRESDVATPYDGHHIAMYVGETSADYERAFAHALQAGIVWVNPRFSDKTMDIEGARQWNQFRLKDIIDVETGEVLMELEHEMRSIEHESWPGSKQ